MQKAARQPQPKIPKQTINGWIVLDKPEGITSTQAVGAIKHILRPQKIGHTGTLDPLATGVLPLALGEATKAVPYIMAAQKGYEFTVKWGQATDTDDAQGQVIATSDKRPERAAIEALLPDFIGDIEQLPPQYSALKVNGQRAYDLARAGETVELKPRAVRIDSFTIQSHAADGATTTFVVTCGQGTYVRALARDLGEKLGCYGHVCAVRRTKVGVFEQKGAFSLDFFEQNRHSAAKLAETVLPIARGLDDIPALVVTDRQAQLLKNGGEVAHPRAIREAGLTTGQVIRAFYEEQMIGICRVENLTLKPVRIFNL